MIKQGMFALLTYAAVSMQPVQANAQDYNSKVCTIKPVISQIQNPQSIDEKIPGSNNGQVVDEELRAKYLSLIIPEILSRARWVYHNIPRAGVSEERDTEGGLSSFVLYYNTNPEYPLTKKYELLLFFKIHEKETSEKKSYLKAVGINRDGNDRLSTSEGDVYIEMNEVGEFVPQSIDQCIVGPTEDT